MRLALILAALAALMAAVKMVGWIDPVAGIPGLLLMAVLVWMAAEEAW